MNLLEREIDSTGKGGGGKETEEMASPSNRHDGTRQTAQCILWRDAISFYFHHFFSLQSYCKRTDILGLSEKTNTLLFMNE